jgi:ribonuclease BN (tRNA processing enzyme)
MQSIKVVFLGTGDAFSCGGRGQAAYLIESPKSSLLLDCGSTMLASLRRFNLPAAPIDTIFISHFHGDHIAGLPFLFLHYLYIEPRSKPLRIVGPPGVEKKVLKLFASMYADTAAEPIPYSLEFIEAKPGEPISSNGIRILPFPVPHQEKPPSFGCEINVDGRKIVYTGDTGWTEELVQHSQNADLLICECSYFESSTDTHLNYRQIMQNLERFGAKRIVLTHLGEEVLEKLQEVELETAYDGLSIML